MRSNTRIVLSAVVKNTMRQTEGHGAEWYASQTFHCLCARLHITVLEVGWRPWATDARYKVLPAMKVTSCLGGSYMKYK